MSKNEYEAAARAAKVAKLLERVPEATSEEHVGMIASRVATFTNGERWELCRQAGIRVASETTWGDLVSAIFRRGVAQRRTG